MNPRAEKLLAQHPQAVFLRSLTDRDTGKALLDTLLYRVCEGNARKFHEVLNALVVARDAAEPSPDDGPVSQEYAESYQWWRRYIDARMIAIMAQLQLGEGDAEIRRTTSTDGPHVDRLLCVARPRQEGKS